MHDQVPPSGSCLSDGQAPHGDILFLRPGSRALARTMAVPQPFAIRLPPGPPASCTIGMWLGYCLTPFPDDPLWIIDLARRTAPEQSLPSAKRNPHVYGSKSNTPSGLAASWQTPEAPPTSETVAPHHDLQWRQLTIAPEARVETLTPGLP